MTPAKRKSGAEVKSRVLHAAAKLFLTVGYDKASIIRIADAAEVNRGSLCFVFKDKESMVCELVSHVIDHQFTAVTELLKDKTDDKVLFYAAATVLQLYIAESSEHMREMYNVAYSMPNSSEIIFHKLTEKQQEVFSPYLPGWEVKDFYEREIASAGIMRNHISVPCDIYYTMDRKIKTFLESTLLIYRVPDEKIAEAVAFISQFDWPTIADRVIATMLAYLESKT